MASRAAVAGGAWEPALGPAREDGRVVAESSEPATMAKLTGLPESLDPALSEALSSAGIESLYSHQAAAYETARALFAAHGFFERVTLPASITLGTSGSAAHWLSRQPPGLDMPRALGVPGRANSA